VCAAIAFAGKTPKARGTNKLNTGDIEVADVRSLCGHDRTSRRTGSQAQEQYKMEQPARLPTGSAPDEFHAVRAAG
jgi:hypothetical protein